MSPACRAARSFARRPWPDHTLVLLCYRSQSAIDEFLNPLATIGFRCVDIAFRIRGDAVHAVKFAGLPSALAESRQHFQRLSIQNVDAIIFSVGRIKKFLL